MRQAQRRKIHWRCRYSTLMNLLPSHNCICCILVVLLAVRGSSCFPALVAFTTFVQTPPRQVTSPLTAKASNNSYTHDPPMPPKFPIKIFWNLASSLGVRRIAGVLQRVLPAYRDTIFFFPERTGFVALTIDDGLSRGGTSTSLVSELCELLGSYNAHATFFVCTEYTTTDDARRILANGHELGNHLARDVSGYYSRLDRNNFEAELRKSNKFLDEIDGGVQTRWFRAPQGVITRRMKDVVEENGMRHVLGDVYCDDWAFADSENRHVAPLMLSQVHSGGSIAVFHMPERGFREKSLDAIEQFLAGAKAKGLHCITLSAMEDMSTSPQYGVR